MEILKQIVIIIISIMIGASYSAVLTIGMKREDKRKEGKPLYLLLYSIKFHLFIILLLIFHLIIFLILFSYFNQ